MPKLTSKERNKLQNKDFAIPGKRRYPIKDINHAKNALARVTRFGSGKDQQRVKSAVYERYPELIPRIRFRIKPISPLRSSTNLKPPVLPRLPLSALIKPARVQISPGLVLRRPIHVRNIGGGLAASRKRIKKRS